MAGPGVAAPHGVTGGKIWSKMPSAVVFKRYFATKNIVNGIPCAVLILAGAAQAGPPRPLDMEVLAGTCFACHGPQGVPPAGAAEVLPRLRGRPAAELLRLMRAFRQGQMPQASVMPLLMQGYDDAQMQALAQWFAQPAQPAQTAPARGRER